MSSSPEDPVKLLFEALPEPVNYHANILLNTNDLTWSEINKFKVHLTLFVRRCDRLESFEDPDRKFLYEQAKYALRRSDGAGKKNNCDSIFLFALGVLACCEGQPPPSTLHKSKKDRYMRYAAWILNGRRDHEYPFGPPIQIAQQKNHNETLPQHVTSSNWACACCGKLDATVRCEECFVEESGLLSVYYCDQSCQQAHREQHAAVCRSRREIGRAVSVLYSAQSLFQETLTCELDELIYKADVDNNIGMAVPKLADDDPHSDADEDHIEYPEDRFHERVFRGDFIVPRHVLDKARAKIGKPPTDDQPEAAHHRETGIEAYGFQWPYVQILLKPVCKLIEEVAVTPKNVVVPMFSRSKGIITIPALDYHHILRVQAESGEEFAIDLAGSMYGWKDRVFLWKHYQDHRVHVVDYVKEEGQYRALVAKQQAVPNVGPGVAPLDALAKMRFKIIDKTAEHMLKPRLSLFDMGDVRNLYQLPRDEFVAQKAGIVDTLRMALFFELDSLKDRGSHRLYYQHYKPYKPHLMYQIRVAVAPDLIEFLKNIWLGKKKVRKLIDDPEKIHEAWESKARAAEEQRDRARARAP